MARITEADVQALQRAIAGLPERPQSRFPYPAPRKRRPLAEGMGDFVGEEGALDAFTPTVGEGNRSAVLLPFYVASTAGNTSVAVSRRFRGPAWLADGFWQPNIQGNAVAPLFGIHISVDDAQGGANQTAFAVSGRTVFERGPFVPSGAEAQPAGEGLFSTQSFGGGNHNPFPLGVWIPEPEFFIKFHITSRGGASNVTGWVRLFEQVSPDFRPVPV